MADFCGKILGPFEHGGELFRIARQLGVAPKDCLDFSASINPLGIPPGVMAAVQESLADLMHYPEADAGALIADLAAHHAIPAEHLLVGNGSTELLYLLPRVFRPRRALLPCPAFSEYERSLALAGSAIDLLPLDPKENFRLDPERLLRRLEPDTDLIFLASPANPSGMAMKVEDVCAIAAAVRSQAVVAVDEAFIDFCPEVSAIQCVAEFPNLYVFRSLTKFYAIPGLRVGYMAGPVRGIARLATAQPPWSVSTPSLAAARACLAEEEYRRRSVAAIPPLRQTLAAGLAALGLKVFPGAANFILARLEIPGRSAAELRELLLRQRILIRDCGNFACLDPRYLRVAVRTEQENARLLRALGEIFDLWGGDVRGTG